MPFQIPNEKLSGFFSELEAVVSESWTMLIGKETGLRPVETLSFQGEQVFSALKIHLDESYVMKLNLPKETAETLAEYFYGEPIDDQEELMESVGEVLNIFAGNLMGILPEGWKMEPPSYQMLEGYNPVRGVYSQCFYSTVGGFHLSIVEA